MGLAQSAEGSASRSYSVESRSRSREIGLAPASNGLRVGPRYMPLMSVVEDPSRAGSRASRRDASRGGTLRSTVGSAASSSGRSGDLDIVQFSCPIFFGEENEEHIEIEVMRLGTFQDRARVRYETQDASAKAGLRYKSTSGWLTFEEGVASQTIPLELLVFDLWSSVLEFKVILSEPENCELGQYLHTTRVKVIDNDAFPSSKYREELEETDDLEGAVELIPGLGLFFEYCRLLLFVPGLGLKILATLVFDQMSTMYLFFKLYANMYLVNTLFNMRDPAAEQDWLIVYLGGGETGRHRAAVLIGLGYVIPTLALHAWDMVKIRIHLHGHIRTFLQENIFRHYLNLSEDTRYEVKDSQVEEAILYNADKLAEGFSGILDVLRICGRIIVMMCFTLLENPDSLWCVCLMIVSTVIWMSLRHGLFEPDPKRILHTKCVLREIVQEAIHRFHLVVAYAQRPAMTDRFCHQVELFCQEEIPELSFTKNNDYFFKWIDSGFVLFFLTQKGPCVLDGTMDLGSFLAQLSVFKEVCSCFSEGYAVVIKATQTIDEMRELCVLLNRPTDCIALKNMNRKRRKEMSEERSKMLSQVHHGDMEQGGFRSDLLTINLRNMSFAHSASDDKLFSNVNLSVSQGRMVAIVGAHGEGSNTLLRLIAQQLFPTQGSVFVPTHLRSVYVTKDPVLLHMSAWHNLTFGLPVHHGISLRECGRIENVLKMLEMNRTLQLIKGDLQLHRRKARGSQAHKDADPQDNCFPMGCFAADDGHDSDEEEEEEEEEEDDGDTEKKDGSDSEDEDLLVMQKWQETLNTSEKVKIHLARALLMNPEVILLQRPLHHFDPDTEMLVSHVLRLHMDNRGLGLPEESRHRRRPRSCFFSGSGQESYADVIWRIKDGSVRARDVTPQERQQQHEERQERQQHEAKMTALSH